MAVNEQILEGAKDYYSCNIMDWRSFKLTRVSRSPLAAESSDGRKCRSPTVHCNLLGFDFGFHAFDR